ncbi:hypothetical protein ACLOJK_021150 [Asimina triloba]
MNTDCSLDLTGAHLDRPDDWDIGPVLAAKLLSSPKAGAIWVITGRFRCLRINPIGRFCWATDFMMLP